MTAWGKRGKGTPTGAPELSLLGHCADVASVVEALLRLKTYSARLERLACRPLEAADISRLCCFALWHDLGKANFGFWSQRFGEEGGAARRRSAGLQPSDRGHTAIVATLLRHDVTRVRFCEVFPLEEVCTWGPSLDLLWAAVSHHGSPLSAGFAGGMVGIDERMGHLKAAWTARDGYNPMAEIAALAAAARQWFPEAFRADAPTLPGDPAFTHAFAGIVSLADWIASNPDPDFFPYLGDGGPDRMTFARPRARDVLARMRIDVEAPRARLRERMPDFAEALGFAPREAQAVMGRKDLGQIVVLESETGSGKTEAALWRFATLFAAGEVDSLAFLLPTRVAATAMVARINRFLTKLFGCDPAPLNCVLGVPGYAYADGTHALERLAGFETLWPDTEDDDAAHRRWAAEHPKRFLAASVMVGTVDQALLGSLRVRHAHLRGAALLRSLLVVDEVHASDAYMTGLLQEVLTRQVRAGGHALLLSATLGGATRNALLASGLQPVRRNRLAATVPQDRHPRDDAYPAVSDVSGMRVAPPRGPDKQIAFQISDHIADPEAIAAMAAGAARGGARVLIVRNTVGQAIQVQQSLEIALADAPNLLFTVGSSVAMHHGRYAAEDRKVLDLAVEGALGKSAQRPHGLVVVGTQTLEQSLDIDADFLITDVAPADVLLQRFGRLHRHRDRPRPFGFDTPRAIILAPADGLSPFLTASRGKPSFGFGTTYLNLPSVQATLLELTKRTIIQVPTDCRELVESTVDFEYLSARCREWGGPWHNAMQAVYGRTNAEMTEAHHARLDWTVPWDHQPPFPRRSEEDLRTRLGLNDRLVALPYPWTSPFGAPLTQIKVPGWMLRGTDLAGTGEDAPAEVVDQVNSGLVFRWAGAVFRYGRVGLERI